MKRPNRPNRRRNRRANKAPFPKRVIVNKGEEPEAFDYSILLGKPPLTEQQIERAALRPSKNIKLRARPRTAFADLGTTPIQENQNEKSN